MTKLFSKFRDLQEFSLHLSTNTIIVILKKSAATANISKII